MVMIVNKMVFYSDSKLAVTVPEVSLGEYLKNIFSYGRLFFVQQ